ncbi:MAG: class I adenylate-forming enzyme family protein [Tepidanaerobacteraceae bacterium]|jgi:long-chain acyl-CoA synthetase|nr:acyl--CoA ligase [Thermoanaerobacterales bacterium]
MNISSIISQNVSFYSRCKAIIASEDGRTYTWAELEKNINKLGNALLNFGVRRGEIVAVYLPNSPEVVLTYFAIARIGAIFLPINIHLKTNEISHILNNSRSHFLIGSSVEIKDRVINQRFLFPHLRKVITVGDYVDGCADFYSLMEAGSSELETYDCAEDEPCALVYTSGTTGKPKGAILSHGNILSIGAIDAELLHINDQDLLLTATPYCHIFFVQTIVAPFIKGAGIITMNRFSPEKSLEIISRYKVTHYCGVPTMYVYMLNRFNRNKYDLKSWRVAQTAGASMPAKYIRQIEEKFGVNICETYGTTETSSCITYNRIGHGKVGSVGRVARGIQIKVVDNTGREMPADKVGEILVKSPGMFLGYWEMPEATKAAFNDGWYRTGDLGIYDKDGYFYIVGRKNELIISGGYNIFPKEVEDVIHSHPKVAEAAVVGVENPELNEVPKAFVVMKPGEHMTEEELIHFCKGELADYKVPLYVEFIQELPKTSTGKILKALLQKKPVFNQVCSKI